MKSERSCDDELNRHFVNTIGAGRIFMRAALEPPENCGKSALKVRRKKAQLLICINWKH